MKEHLFNIHDIALIVTMSQCILVAALQSLIPTQNRLSHTLLTAFFLLIFLNTAGILLLWNEALQAIDGYQQRLVPIALVFSFLLKGPVLYFYLRSICEPTFRLTHRQWTHMLPVVVALSALAGFDINANDLLTVDKPSKIHVVFYLWTSCKLAPVIYAAICAYTIRNVNQTLMNHYSNINDTGAGWAYILVIGYLLHWTWSLLTHLIGANVDISVSDTFGIIDNYLSFIMINLLFVCSLFYARRLIAAISAQETSAQATDKKPAPNVLPLETTINKVYKGIQEDKLFLEQNINIEQFAHRVGLTTRDASHAINTHFNVNFFEFINQYRVEEAKRLLASSQYKDATILDILYQSGFNSKSAFHRFFKRIVGVPPSEYRRTHLKP